MRSAKRRFNKIAQSQRDGDYRRRVAPIVDVKGDSISETALELFETRKSVRDCKAQYERFGGSLLGDT